MALKPLDEQTITTHLGALPGWSREGKGITKTFERPSFPGAISFVVRIGELAERADHHPDIDIRYRQVKVAMWTHDAGGLTERDFELARRVEAAAEGAEVG